MGREREREREREGEKERGGREKGKREEKERERMNKAFKNILYVPNNYSKGTSKLKKNFYS